MHVEPKAATHGTHREERFVPREAPHRLPDRRTARNDREDGRATPGQVRLQQARCPQPCAQRFEIAPTAPQNCFETVAATDEHRRFNSLPPKGPRKSEVVIPQSQVLSGPVVSGERIACRHTPFGDRDHGTKWRAESKGAQHLTTSGAERRTASECERHIRSKFQRQRPARVRRGSATVQCEQAGDGGGRVGAAPAHPGLGGDALGEREARTAREPEPPRHEVRCAQHEIVAARRHGALRRARRAPVRLGVLVPHAQREPARCARHRERVVERDRLEHGDQVVEAVRAPGAHREPEIQLGVRVNRDLARRGSFNRRPPRADAGAPAARHRAMYRIHTVIAT